jgi:SAM-dependent methyltransferase
MNLREFQTFGESISRKLGTSNALHNYFVGGAARIWKSCDFFGLFENESLGRVLEVGPFYGYIPFLLRERCTSYSVIEGPDPAADALLPLYKEAGIDVALLDFFEIFGPTRSADHKLPYPDDSFETVICWETMEHFNFNPVKFVRELHRVCAPGAKVHITVPNKASFQAIAGLFSQNRDPTGIQSYYEFENFQSDGKTAFYGFHWREYTAEELSSLFSTAGFKIAQLHTAVAFHQHNQLSLKRRLLRQINECAAALFPRHGTNVFLTAVK